MCPQARVTPPVPWRVSDRAPSGVLPDRVVPALVWDVPAAVHMHPHVYTHTLHMYVQVCAHLPPPLQWSQGIQPLGWPPLTPHLWALMPGKTLTLPILWPCVPVSPPWGTSLNSFLLLSGPPEFTHSFTQLN